MTEHNGYSSLLVSDYILSKFNTKDFTQGHLIKLTFLSHGWTLALHDKPLIQDRIEAWKYGPVIPVLYHELKMWGEAPVPALRYCGTNRNDQDELKRRTKFFDSILQEDTKVIDGVIKAYGGYSFSELQLLCHAKESPWDQVYTGKAHQEIPDHIIKDYYKKQMNS